ncbi:hypothetical protein [Haloarchaeobius sp. TZWWS8]|uniref:hypothetical protein n=1 Tax=Haloarchaeobius sp. TZWWS8 TaxID=3446121 RepID=UPI003EBB7CCF
MYRGAFAVVVVAVAVGVTPVVVASFVDTAHSDGSITGATFDLSLSEIGPATHDSTIDETDANRLSRSWADYDHATGGGTSVTNTLRVSVTGSASPSTLVIETTFTENDSTLGSPDNLDKTAQTVVVQEFVYDGTDLVGTAVVDENGNGRVDLKDLVLGSTADNLSSLSPPVSGSPVDLQVRLSGEADLLAGVGAGDGIDIDFVMTARYGSLRDADNSTDNTIVYD